MLRLTVSIAAACFATAFSTTTHATCNGQMRMKIVSGVKIFYCVTSPAAPAPAQGLPIDDPATPSDAPPTLPPSVATTTTTTLQGAAPDDLAAPIDVTEAPLPAGAGDTPVDIIPLSAPPFGCDFSDAKWDPNPGVLSWQCHCGQDWFTFTKHHHTTAVCPCLRLIKKPYFDKRDSKFHCRCQRGKPAEDLAYGCACSSGKPKVSVAGPRGSELRCPCNDGQSPYWQAASTTSGLWWAGGWLCPCASGAQRPFYSALGWTCDAPPTTTTSTAPPSQGDTSGNIPYLGGGGYGDDGGGAE